MENGQKNYFIKGIVTLHDKCQKHKKVFKKKIVYISVITCSVQQIKRRFIEAFEDSNWISCKLM